MRHLAHLAALAAACIVLAGSAANASPRRARPAKTAKHHAPAGDAREVETTEAEAEADAQIAALTARYGKQAEAKPARAKRIPKHVQIDADEDDDQPARPRKHVEADDGDTRTASFGGRTSARAKRLRDADDEQPAPAKRVAKHVQIDADDDDEQPARSRKHADDSDDEKPARSRRHAESDGANRVPAFGGRKSARVKRLRDANDDDSDDSDDSSAGLGDRSERKSARAKRLRDADRDSDSDDSDDDSDDDAPKHGRKHAANETRKDEADDEGKTHRVAFADRDVEGESIGETVAPREPADLEDTTKIRKHKRAGAHAKDWSVALGPYLWASSVDANVSLGPASVSTGVDFISMTKHARYGAEMLGEARYGRFSLSGDLMYGVVAVDGAREVGPLMVGINGEASSLLIDGMGGYRVLGSDTSKLSLEALAGVRYQRTAVKAAIDIAGGEVAQPSSVQSGADGVAGARVTLRPASWFFVSGAADYGVFGASNSTWSASADAGVHLGSHVQLSLGWRTLTIDRSYVALTMHGPRAAVQLTF